MPQQPQTPRLLVARYRLGPEIGAGAHGRVHLAEDLGRGGAQVALKLVRGRGAGSDWLEGAARILRWFRHPNWADILDTGSTGSDEWFEATRLVRGTSLAALSGPQDPDTVWRFLEDGARVLGALHRQGLIHYDITPGNFLREDEDDGARFVLTDGGLAHIGPVEGFGRGTPLYTAPEQATRAPHDHRVDLYALGLIAFELATGRRPFGDDVDQALPLRRRQAAPRCRDLRESVPQALDDLIATLLERRPDDRPADGTALLGAIREAHGQDVPALSPLEAQAAADGGQIVGHRLALDRFARSSRALARSLAVLNQQRNGAPPPGLQEPVLLLSGPAGIGCTRVARECVQTARADGVPVLLLAGRDGAPDAHDPLSGLEAALVELHRNGGGPERRSRRVNEQRRARAFSKQRAIEQFVNLAQGAARRSPFVLVVEDYGELPGLARSAIEALTRELSSRAEHGPEQAAPPILVVVDLGATDPDRFLIADSARPDRPVARLERFEAEEVHEFCTSRFPSLELTEDALRAIHRASSGLPRTAAAMLGEAAHRNDLRADGDHWSWDTTHLDTYEVNQTLTRQQAAALRAADQDLRAFLEHLALTEAGIPESTAHQLWSGTEDAGIPTSPLIVARWRGGKLTYAIASNAVRTHLCRELARDEGRERTRVEAILSVLEGTVRPGGLLDRARLLLRIDKAAEAIDLLRQGWALLDAEHRFGAQYLVSKAVDTDPEFLRSPARRSAVATLLERGPDAVATAQKLADAFSKTVEEAEAVLHVAEVLEDARYPEAALALLREQSSDSDADEPTRARLGIRRAMLALNLRHIEEAEQAHVDARDALRASRSQGPRPQSLQAEYLRLWARLNFRRHKSLRAIRLLLAADRAARRARDSILRSQLQNNLGIAYANSNQLTLAAVHFRRSLRFKKAIGDVRGWVTTSVNLALLHLSEGALLEATQVCADSVRRSQRYGLHESQVRALRQLAEAYDRQHRPTLALNTLLRAWRMLAGERAPDGHPNETAGRVAEKLAPVAAAVGRLDLTERMLKVTAGAARAPGRAEGARARHHLTAALVGLHAGHGRAFRLGLKRALRHASSLTPGDLRTLGFLTHFLPDHPVPRDWLAGARQQDKPTLRYLFRIFVWAHRVRGGRGFPLPIPGLMNTRESGPRGIPAGSHGRLAAEILLSVARQSPGIVDDGILAQIQSYARLSDATSMQARILAERAIRTAPHQRRHRAHLFSSAVSELDRVTAGSGARSAAIPDVVCQAADLVQEGLSCPTAKPLRLHDLHAVAHKALVRPGVASSSDSSTPPAVADERLAAALRRVLEASAQMRGSDDVKALLASITRHTLDITGAQRVCVVLRDADSGLEMRESADACDANQPVDIREVSHTVIHKVMESQAPFFKPYVIEDAALLEESDSIPQYRLLSILCVPLQRRGELYGVLYADSTSVGAFEPVDLEVLSLFAEQAAAAIEASRLVEDLQRSFLKLKEMQDRLVKGERLRVVGELSSGVAHEFNNLLTAILARIQMMSLSYIPPEARRDLELIEKAALDAAAVVRRMQSLSRQQRQADFTLVDLSEVAKDAVDLLRPLWKGPGRGDARAIDVRLQTEPSLNVRGDPTELREVFTNLLKNAIDSIHKTGTIHVAARRSRGQIELEVRDDGCGVSPDEVRRVFDAFYTTKGERGTGLGLALSQQIVERHGGSITMASEPGVGTAVTAVLPAAEHTVDLGEAGKGARDTHGDGLRVVVVDDDADVLRPLCRFLETSGYEVVPATNGSEGLEEAMRSEPDVVLTDTRMPGVDGIELCRRLHEAKPHLPIVLMSGWASDLDRSRAWEAGARDVLHKPFEMTRVAELLASVVRRRN